MKLNLKKILLLAMVLSLSLVIMTGCTKKEDEAPKAKIGISWAADEIDADAQLYADAVKKAGGEPVFLKQFTNEEEAKKAIEEVDAVIITGGDDLNPALYNEEPHPNLEDINPIRDTSDVALIKACLEMDKHTLATCRGMQLTNILSGGTLYQDIITQRPTEIVHRDPNREVFVKHEVTIVSDTLLHKIIGQDGIIEVNSWHHQAIKDLGENLDVVATAADGTIEAIVRNDKTYFIGFQWHPEDLIINDNDEFALKIYEDFINQVSSQKETK